GRIYLERYQATGDLAFVDRAFEEFKSSIDDARKERFFVASDDLLQGSLGIAWCHLIRGRAEAALSVAEQVIEKFPSTEEAYVLAGVALASLGNYDRAQTEFKRAIALRPTYAKAHAHLGDRYSHRGALAL